MQPTPARPTLHDLLAPRLEEATTYEAFYGLRERPFSLSSDPKFLFHSTTHDRVAQELLSAIRRRDALVIITADPGLGKTMLCRAVMDQLDHRTLTSFVADPSVSIEEVLKTILVDFGVIAPAEPTGHLSRQDLSRTLREFLLSLAPLEAFAVVFIDQAQNLPIDALDEIRTLSEASGDGEGRLLQFVLVGQPKLLRLLRRSEVRPFAQRAAVRCELEPLPGDEVDAYVLHRLAVAGANARIEFDETSFARLHELSDGVPRTINLLCDQALKLGHDASSSVIDAATIDRAADDLNIERPSSGVSRLAHVVATTVALVVLMLVGAGAGALVFHDRVARIIGRWEAIPEPPRPPALRQPAPFVAPPAPPPGGWPDSLPTRPRSDG